MFKYRKHEKKHEVKPIPYTTSDKLTDVEYAKLYMNSIFGKDDVLLTKQHLNQEKLIKAHKRIIQEQDKIIREQQQTITRQRKEMAQVNAYLKQICNVTLTKRANTIFIDID